MKLLTKKSLLNTTIKIILLVVLCLFAFLMMRISYPYLVPPYPTTIDFLATKQDVLHIEPWKIAFYIHISSSFLVILAGLTQFSNTLLKKRPKIHRNIGKLYVVVILFISGPSGMLMAFYANGGIFGQIAFTTLSVLWITFTYLAYRYIRKGNVLAHGKWMFRSFALSLSAVTLRLLMFTIGILPFYVDFEIVYMINGWLSWMLNLGITEILIRKGIVNRYFGRN
ncbi:MAG: DUF2306 domain-containing protein [Saprospiraceae bacterium]